MISQQNIIGGNIVTPQNISAQVAAQNSIISTISNIVTTNPNGESYIQIYASEALTKGDPLYVISFDVTSSKAVVGRAVSNDASKMPAIAVAKSNANALTYGTALVKGFIIGVNTTQYTQNSPIYVGSSGGYSATGGTYQQEIGKVYLEDNPNDGIILVNIGNVSSIEPIPKTVVRRSSDGSIYAYKIYADGSVIKDHVFPEDSTFTYESEEAAAAHREALGIGNSFQVETSEIINTNDIISYNGFAWTNASPETITNGGNF
jgi:hypothetical protein